MDIYGDLDREVRVGRDTSDIPNDAQLPAPYLGRGDGFWGKGQDDAISTLSIVQDVVRRVQDKALGLVKNFEGMYGGLGTIDGELAAIGLETGIEGTDDLENGNWLSEEEKAALGEYVT